MRSNQGQAGVNRLLSRLVVEYQANGWTIASLCRKAGTHRSILDRWLDGRVAHPLLGLFVAYVEAMGMRVDIVAPHHQPLLTLNEFELDAVIRAAAGNGWRGEDCRYDYADHLTSALTKLNKIKEATPDA